MKILRLPLFILTLFSITLFLCSCSPKTYNQKFSYTANGENSVIITAVDSSIYGDVVIPSEIDGYTVCGIGENVFSSNTQITSVTIPDSVKIIGSYAFGGCTALSVIEIKGSPTSIAANAFDNTAIGENYVAGCVYVDDILIKAEKINGEFVMKEGTKGCADGIFSGFDRLSSIVLPSTLNSVSSRMFEDCERLEEINIPAAVTEIASDAFEGCDRLKAINVDEDNKVFTSEKGLLLTEGGTKLIRCPQKYDGEIFEGREGITQVGEHAFSGCKSFTGIRFVNKLKYLGAYAFDGCISLENYSVSSALDNIYEYTFRNCKNLKSVTMTAYIQTIGKGCFYGCTSLKEFDYTVSTFISRIETYTFYGCKALSKISLSDNITTLSDSCFAGCTSLKKINLKSVNSISTDAFKGCEKLEKIVISSSLEEIAANAFSGCETLKAFTAPKTLKSLGYGAFEGCAALTKADLSAAVLVSTGTQVFKGCEKLESIILPDELMTVSDSAFSGCKALKKITLPENLNKIEKNAFEKSGITEITIPESVKSVQQDAFKGCKALKTVTFNGSNCSVYFSEGTIPKTADIVAPKNSTAMQYAEEFGNVFLID